MKIIAPQGLLIAALIYLLAVSSCSDNKGTNQNEPNQYNILPMPNKLVAENGQFVLPKVLVISADSSLKNETQILRSFILTQAPEQVVEVQYQRSNKSHIQLVFSDSVAHQEGYQLLVSAEGIKVKAATAAGIFYGINSLSQLLSQKDQVTSIPFVRIFDAPRFEYRGMHLDVGRHYFPPSFIKKYIDGIAMHKMNRFHWHLTEDQGWRIEIKKYPKLTSIGSVRKETILGHAGASNPSFDGKEYKGFYTQEEIKEIVGYAQMRHVTIIPEIEMPGHAQAALAAYPELGCTGGPYEVSTKWGIEKEVFCTTETTFEFLENVLKEVMDLFPSQYIHIGGDECPKDRWKLCKKCQSRIRSEGLSDEHELQSYFIKRIETFLNKNGKKLIGWDEILEGGLAPDATVMSWRGVQGGVKAAQLGHDAIMTPQSHCYFDHYQSDDPSEPLAIGGFLPLQKVYAFEPIPKELNQQESKRILGAQGNVWTEYMQSEKHVEYMVYPRIAALAEVVWSNPEHRNYQDFSQRLHAQFKRYELLEIHAANHFYDINKVHQLDTLLQQFKVQLHSWSSDTIRYTTDGSPVNQQSTLYQQPIEVTQTMKIQAQAYTNNLEVGRLFTDEFVIHQGIGADISLAHQPVKKYTFHGKNTLLNGRLGGKEFADGEWLGFIEKPLVAEVDLKTSNNLQMVNIRFYDDPDSWIFLPEKLTVMASENGADYTEVFTTSNVLNNNMIPLNLEARYIKIIGNPISSIPVGHPGVGKPGWLFVDEIEIK